jgi:hypothetical protein
MHLLNQLRFPAVSGRLSPDDFHKEQLERGRPVLPDCPWQGVGTILDKRVMDMAAPARPDALLERPAARYRESDIALPGRDALHQIDDVIAI